MSEVRLLTFSPWNVRKLIEITDYRKFMNMSYTIYQIFRNQHNEIANLWSMVVGELSYSSDKDQCMKYDKLYWNVNHIWQTNLSKHQSRSHLHAHVFTDLCQLMTPNLNEAKIALLRIIAPKPQISHKIWFATVRVGIILTDLSLIIIMIILHDIPTVFWDVLLSITEALF